MKKRIILVALVLSACLISVAAYAFSHKAGCFTGAFIADNPRSSDILEFKNSYGRRPYLVMVFLDWLKLPDQRIIKDIYAQGCVLFLTWEPWDSLKKEGIDFDSLLSGRYDSYIKDFALQLKGIKKVVYLRFGHEMNGNWYPWSGQKIGKDKYIKVYRYVNNIFKDAKADNVKWVFSFNWEDVPREGNHFSLYYPGDDYVDYLGIDGYNWGDSQSWSKWMSFKDIFVPVYNEISLKFNRPVLISEFGSASSGGDKTQWIKEALVSIKAMGKIKGFVLFNVNKETEWKFSPQTKAGRELKRALRDSYYQDKE
jgi:beta-mannanase